MCRGVEGSVHMEILPQTAIDAAHGCVCVLIKEHYLPPTLSLSVTDVYMLISDCASTCALQKFLYIHTIINIYKTQFHIHSYQVMYL